MSSFYVNEQGKIRLGLSNQAISVIEGDMCTFGITKKSTFMNTIIAHGIEDTKTFPNKYLHKKRQKMLDELVKCAVSQDDKEKIVDTINKNEYEAIKKELYEYINTTKDKEFHITLNKENLSYFNGDFEEDDLNIYKYKLGTYLKCLFEEYSNQSFLRRERIYRKDVYEKLEHAIKLEKALEIATISKNGNRHIYYVYPYKILSDITRTQDYLTCFSKLPDESSHAKIPAAFAISKLNIDDIKILKEHTSLNTDDLKKIQVLLSQNSPGNLLDESIKITVELTPKGEYFYRTSLYNRPTRINTDCKNNIYEFQCTAYNAIHYFASFGKEVKIIYPESLRKSFINLYSDALQQYR